MCETWFSYFNYKANSRQNVPVFSCSLPRSLSLLYSIYRNHIFLGPLVLLPKPSVWAAEDHSGPWLVPMSPAGGSAVGCTAVRSVWRGGQTGPCRLRCTELWGRAGRPATCRWGSACRRATSGPRGDSGPEDTITLRLHKRCNTKLVLLLVRFSPWAACRRCSATQCLPRDLADSPGTRTEAAGRPPAAGSWCQCCRATPDSGAAAAYCPVLAARDKLEQEISQYPVVEQDYKKFKV